MRIVIIMTLFTLLFISCNKSAHEHSHDHETGGLEPLAYTIYSNNSELFVEFKPLVIGNKSNFVTHITILGERFLPLTEGNVTVSLIVGEYGIRNTADSASSAGIFKLALIPKNEGVGKLIFDIVTKDFTDQIVIENIRVYPDEQTAIEQQILVINDADEINFLKEQAWKVEFANTEVQKTAFSDIIKTYGQILSAPGDEIMLTANANGTLIFSGNNTIVGSKINKGTALFTISGGNITEGNLDIAYNEAKANYNKTKAEFDRANELVKDKIISQKDFLQAKLDFENARAVYNSIARNYSANGQNIPSPIAGFVKNIFVSEGQFVETGTPLAIISQNKKLILQVNVSQRYFHKLSTISSANFKTAGSETVFNTQDLNGKVISYGRSTSANSPLIPITFEIDNIGNIIPGSIAEVYLKSSPIPNALIIPYISLMEELGNYYVFVQTRDESFQKREVKLGASDGIHVQILSGLEEGERVVTKGAYRIKLSSASGEIPAHGHEH